MKYQQKPELVDVLAWDGNPETAKEFFKAVTPDLDWDYEFKGDLLKLPTAAPVTVGEFVVVHASGNIEIMSADQLNEMYIPVADPNAAQADTAASASTAQPAASSTSSNATEAPATATGANSTDTGKGNNPNGSANASPAADAPASAQAAGSNTATWLNNGVQADAEAFVNKYNPNAPHQWEASESSLNINGVGVCKPGDTLVWDLDAKVFSITPAASPAQQ